MNKVRTIEEAAALVPDGATVAIGGLSMNSTPMAFVRELCRRQVRDLTLVPIVNGMAVDWLIAAGCVSKVISGLVSFEGMGLAPMFRHAVQSKQIEIEEYSEHLLICRMQAAEEVEVRIEGHGQGARRFQRESLPPGGQRDHVLSPAP